MTDSPGSSGSPGGEPDRPGPGAAGDLTAEESSILSGSLSGTTTETGPDTGESAAPARREISEILGPAPRPILVKRAFRFGFVAGLGAMLAWWLGTQIQTLGSVFLLIVVAFFLGAGLNPGVEFFMRHGLKRPWAVLAVTGIFLLGVTLFFVALVPVVADQVTTITENAPGWLAALQENQWVQRLDDRFDIVGKVSDYIEGGDWASSLFGGFAAIGLAVVSALANSFILLVLTLYILASLPSMKAACYRFAPASQRPRVAELGDRIISNIGGYVSGAFWVALAAGITTAIFLVVIGLGEYAVALALVVALLDLIPMIGATLGAVVVSAIALATDPWLGLVSIIFYIVYQQVENYLIYPRVMSRAVDISGALIVIAALIGATLLGVVGALLAIPTAAALQLLVQELFLKRQDAR